MHRRPRHPLLIATVLLTTPGLLPADIVILKDGKAVEGEVRDQGDAYDVTTKYGTLTVRKEDVSRVVRDPSVLATQADVLRRTGLALLAETEKPGMTAADRDTKRMAAEATLQQAAAFYRDARSVAKPEATGALDASIAEVTQALARCRAAAGPSDIPPAVASRSPEVPPVAPAGVVAPPPPPVTPAKVAQPPPQQPDPEAINSKATALNAELRAARTAEEAGAAATSCLALAGEAAEADLFDLALSLISRADSAARQIRNAALSEQATALRKEIEPVRLEYQKVRNDLKALETKPDDPAANLAVGLFRCVAQQDWERGLPMLARGSDVAVKALAETETGGGPSAPEEMTALADAWWQAAAQKSGATRSAFSDRAAYWYESALPRLTGLNKIRIEKRLQEWEKSRPAQARSGSPVDLLAWIDPAAHSLAPRSPWSMKERTLVSGPNSGDLRFTRLLVPCIPPPEYDVTLRVRHAKGEGPFGVILVAQGRPFAVTLDPGRVSAGLFGDVDSHDLAPRYPADKVAWKGAVFGDTPSVVVCSVRRGHLRVTVNGQAAIDWKNPPFATAAPPAEWAMPDPQCLGLVARDVATYEVTQFVLKTVGGGVPRRATAPIR